MLLMMNVGGIKERRKKKETLELQDSADFK
jgi:hypothetical protein